MRRKNKVWMVINYVCMAIACVLALVLILANLLGFSVHACDGGRVTTARQDALHEAADILRAVGYAEDSATIHALQEAWRQEQEDLQIIAKVIQNEADPAWCEWDHSVAVGAVVCNRVKSPYFPDSVKAVVEQPGQYLRAYTSDFSGVSRLAYEAAKAAMDGDHDVPEDCFWQDTHIQGVSVWKAFVVDTGWFRSTTYICRGILG